MFTIILILLKSSLIPGSVGFFLSESRSSASELMQRVEKFGRISLVEPSEMFLLAALISQNVISDELLVSPAILIGLGSFTSYYVGLAKIPT